MNEYLEMWKRYADFSGRTSIKGYWMAFLFNFLAMVILTLLVRAASFFSYLMIVYDLAVLIPSLSISVRRIRDAGKPWGFIFFGLIPVVGPIILLVFLCSPSRDS